MSSQGYVRFPTISHDLIVFVAEDDLWLVSSTGGRAERLTAGVNAVTHPRFSPDGKHLAFVGREEGPYEVYVMPALGGPARRLTYQSGYCQVLGWTPAGDEILYTSNAGQFSHRYEVIYAVKLEGGLPRQLPFGMANDISYSHQGQIVIGRNTGEMSHWKRYKGGNVGHLWCDLHADGSFQRLLHLNGNIADPCWVGERIYFLSDHENIANLYSCTATGEDLQQHTRHSDFYARHLSTDGIRLVYQAGAELYLFDPHLPPASASQRLVIELPSLRTQRSRKFVSASAHLDTYALHPQGHAVALTTRGKAFTMGNWEGPVLQHGERDGVRYRFMEWLNDGKRLLAIHDAPGRETLVLFNPTTVEEPKVFAEFEFGRATNLVVSPTEDQVALTNHRHELIVVDLATGEARVLDHSDCDRIRGATWSPDGCWLAYSFALTPQRTAIKLCLVETGESYQVTEPILEDCDPAFDPDGKYLYFLGTRVFNPVRDNLQFELSFPRGIKPYLITLRRDQRSPFIPEMKNFDEKEDESTKRPASDAAEVKAETAAADEKEKKEKKASALQIDLDGITERVLPFPLPEARYSGVLGLRGKVLFLSFPVEGTTSDSHGSRGILDMYDFESYKTEKLLDGISSCELSRDYKHLIYASAHRLRVIKAGEKPPKSENGDRAGRETGWLDLGRMKVSVQPAAEWQQMFKEAWRLQREHFWTADMSGVDWDEVYAQYFPLVERVSTRAEFSDLLHELQGELGTSHTYEQGGEYRHGPYYRQGTLGVDWSYDAEHERYRIAHIIKGDPSDPAATSPLTSPGLNISAGDAVLAINGQPVGPQRIPQELLVNQAGNEVQITLEDGKTQERRNVIVKAAGSDTGARYREWVEHNRRFVHESSQDRVGYIHIPDMQNSGYAEFHRSYLAEYDYPALLIDVRWNSGGNVSSLLLEKLMRRRIGYKFSRWYQPSPYPRKSPRGPMVALANEHAASDGDIFSHSFKLMGLGPLVGMRTWGGVIGYSIRHHLVDGTVTTQPEYSSWFRDVGWNVENYGTEPDIEVDIAPQDFAAASDPQLERAIAEALRLIAEVPVLEPRPGDKPHRGRQSTEP